MAQARNPLVQLTKLLPNSANVTLVLPLRFALQANIAPRRVSAQEEVEVQLRRNENVQRCDAWAVGGLYAPYAANHEIGWPYCVGSHASVGSSFQRDGLRAEGSLSLSRSSKIPS